MEAVVGTMIPFIGGGLGSIVTRKNIKTWYPVRVFLQISYTPLFARLKYDGQATTRSRAPMELTKM